MYFDSRIPISMKKTTLCLFIQENEVNVGISQSEFTSRRDKLGEKSDNFVKVNLYTN